jgi:NNP family nitrate/nitrite transporter-like MFS transporter
VATLSAVLAAEGALLIVFSRMDYLPLAIATLVLFGLFTHMSAGATYAVTPFVRRDAVGAVAGVVGAGGNLGAVLAGFLFRSDGTAAQTAFLVLGVCVLASSALVLLVRFKSEDEAAARREIERLRAEAAAQARAESVPPVAAPAAAE